MLSRFHLIPGTGTSRTDGQTDRQICCINNARQCAHAQQKYANYSTKSNRIEHEKLTLFYDISLAIS